MKVYYLHVKKQTHVQKIYVQETEILKKLSGFFGVFSIMHKIQEKSFNKMTILLVKVMQLIIGYYIIN